MSYSRLPLAFFANPTAIYVDRMVGPRYMTARLTLFGLALPFTQTILDHNAADDVLYQQYNRTFWTRIRADQGFWQDFHKYKAALVRLNAQIALVNARGGLCELALSCRRYRLRALRPCLAPLPALRPLVSPQRPSQ